MAAENQALNSSIPGPSSLFFKPTVVQSNEDADSRAKVDEILSSLGTFPAFSGGAILAAKENEGPTSGGENPACSGMDVAGREEHIEPEIPKSINEIFKLSNQNRRRNQEKKRKKVGASGDADVDKAQVCVRVRLWFRVFAALNSFFFMARRLKWVMNGFERQAKAAPGKSRTTCKYLSRCCLQHTKAFRKRSALSVAVVINHSLLSGVVHGHSQ